MNEVWTYVLTGGLAAAVVGAIKELVIFLTGRKDARAGAIKALQDGQRIILHDRIKFLGRSFVLEKEIDLDDRADLLEMHRIYHELGGNGNLTQLMEDVKRLPLKE